MYHTTAEQEDISGYHWGIVVVTNDLRQCHLAKQARRANEIAVFIIVRFDIGSACHYEIMETTGGLKRNAIRCIRVIEFWCPKPGFRRILSSNV